MDIDSSTSDKILEALSNHVILTPILNNLDLRDLKSARLVCQSWFQLASPILLRKSCLRLRQYKGQLYHAESLLGSIAKDGEYFICNVKFEIMDINRAAVGLFSNIGPWIDDLDISLTSSLISATEAFKEILYTKLPNLRRITLRNRGISYRQEPMAQFEELREIQPNTNLHYFLIDSCEDFPINWIQFFTIFPNIKEFHMLNGSISLGQAVLNGISSARKINPRCSKLQKLSLTATQIDGESLWDLIHSLDFHLDGIALNVPDVNRINSILSAYADTLCEAKFVRTSYLAAEVRRFFSVTKPMKCLGHLELDDSIFGNFDFLERTRALKILTLVDKAGLLSEVLLNWALSTTMFPVSCNLSRLDIQSSQLVDSVIVEAIGKSFPNLKSFTMNRMDDDGIRMIFKHLRNLEEMTISGGLITDSGLTGIEAGVPNPEDGGAVNRLLPYIGDLTKLKRLQLSEEYFENITDASILHGLKDLKNLLYVEMPRTSISLNGLEQLRRISNMNLKIPIRLEPQGEANSGFYGILPAEVTFGARFSLVGIVHDMANRIQINLRMESGIVFHFNPRWDEGVTVLNTLIGDSWGNDEKFFYAEMYSGIDMSVRITCLTESFLIEVNDFAPITYKYRVSPEKITAVEVLGDFDVSQVYVGY